jgi:hypothetical protein
LSSVNTHEKQAFGAFVGGVSEPLSRSSLKYRRLQLTRILLVICGWSRHVALK